MNKVEKLCSKRKLSIDKIKYLIENDIIRSWNKYKIGINIYINKIFNQYVDILNEEEIANTKTLIKVENKKVYIRCLIPLLDVGYNKTWIKILPFYFTNKLNSQNFNCFNLSIIDRYHEAMEIKYSVEFIKLYGFVKNDIFRCKSNSRFEKINHHADPRVLREEYKIVNYGSLFDENIDALRNYRIWKGEYSNPKYRLGYYNTDIYGPTAMSTKLIKKYNKIISKRVINNKSWIYQYFMKTFNEYNPRLDWKSIF